MQKIAVIIPYAIYGGAEVYINNFIDDNFLHNFEVKFIHLDSFNRIRDFCNKNAKNILVYKNMLKAFLIKYKFDAVIFYNRFDLYKILLETKKQFNFKLIEINHGDFEWIGSMNSRIKRDGVDLFVTINKNQKQTEFITPEIFYMPPSVDVNLFKYTEKEQGNIKNVAFIGRLSDEKNPFYFLELAKNSKHNFTLYGDGPLKNSIIQRVNTQKITNLRLAGYKENIWDEYGNIDILILPSKMEGLPLTIIESLSCGVKLLCSKVGLIPNLIDDDYFLSFDLIKDLDKMDNLLFNSKKYRDIIEQEYNLKINSSLFLDKILSLLSNKTNNINGTWI